MSQSLTLNVIHLVYSTKGRVPCLDEKLQADLFAYKAGILETWKCSPIVIGGVEDHVHLLFLLSKNHSLAKIVEEVKKGSSKWVKAQRPALRSFHWQNGYGAFSVSSSNVERVRKYVEAQRAGHKGQTYQEELRELLVRHGMEFDERYLWD